MVPKGDLDVTSCLGKQIAGNAPSTCALEVAVGEVVRAASERDEELWNETMHACMGREDFVEGRRAFWKAITRVQGTLAVDFAQL